MFKSLQWKMVTIFVLMVLAIMTAAGTFLILSVTGFYHNLFANEMDSVFNDSFVRQLNEVAAKDEQSLAETIGAHTPRMGIDSYRFYCIISGADSHIVASSEEIDESKLVNTPNMISALAGQVGRKVSSQNPFMDYAVPIEGGGRSYIVYVKDSKEELTRIVQQMFSIILQALLLGIVISLALGYFLSKTITTPISNLTKKAKRLSEGEFEYKIDVKSDDEIGTLTKTFNDMSSKLQESMLEISREKNKMEAMLINMTDGILAFGTDGKVIHMNPTAQKMFGVEAVDDVEFDDFFSKLDADIRMGDMLYFEDNREAERDIAFDSISIKANFVVFDDEQNKTGGILVVLHDVTKQQKLDESRREFVANVSHELRTPLTTVKTYAETLSEMVEENEMASSFANTIINEADRMTRLVKDLLVLSSLDHSKAIKKSNFDISDLIGDVVNTLKPVAREQGHRLTFSTTTKLPEFLGDRDRIEQLLYNIISNSMKYTPNGGKIEVFAGKLYNDIYIKIKDNGIGIPQKDLSRIFERFYRVDKARSRERGGTGLGLAIAKGIVDAHGGQIRINSELDKGTEVIIMLPVLS